MSTEYLLASGVVAGTTYKFRMRAQNKWGFGGFNGVAEIEASAVPGPVDAPSSEISGTNALISWTAPEDYGSTITAYKVVLLTALSAYEEEVVYCDGTQSAIVAALQCEIPVTVLRASPYDLAYDDLIVAKVSAINSNGEGPESTAAGSATIQTEPTQMSAPERGSGTTEGQIQVLWTALTSDADTGSAAITSYNLQWDSGSSEAAWTDLVGYTSSYTETEYIVTTGVAPGGVYAFRVRAYNAHGWGAVSSSFSVAASEEPDQMDAPTTTKQDDVNVRIGWEAADSNSDPLDAYEIMILTSDGVTYAEESVSCDGSTSDPITNNYCDVPMANLRASPFYLVQGDEVIAKVRAHNSIGWGESSSETESATAAIIEDVPHQIGIPTRGDATTIAQIEAEWTALTGDETGGSAVDSYQLQWDAGSAGAAWYDLQGGPSSTDYSLLTSYTATSGVSAGDSYLLQVRAHNAHGWGAFSETATLVAASTPEAPSSATTTIENIYVKIDWTAPASNSASIDGYEVQIADSTGTFVLESTYCDGFTSSAVLADAYCLVPMSVLRGSDYNLVLGDIVRVQVRAHNLYGYGDYSSVNPSGIAIQTAPDQVLSLVLGASTTESQIELNWDELTTSTATGGADILSYNVQWDLGLGTGVYENLVGYASDYPDAAYTITSGVSAGMVFSFRVRAKNMWGWGDYSDVLVVTPSAAPDQMDTLVTAIDADTGSIILLWSAPSDNSAAITQYKVEILDHDGLAWNEETTDCDASDAAVMAAFNCTIAMSAFIVSPFSLVQGDLISVRASALNSNGWGPVSATNTEGAYVMTAPTGMNDPVRDPDSSDSQIIVEWDPLTVEADTGGATVVSYGLEWDAGTDGATWSELAGHTVATLATSFTVTSGLVAGEGYLFRLRAENIYGWGPYSGETLIYAAGLPAQPYQAVTAIDGTDVKITWSEPENSAAPIIAYSVVVLQAGGAFGEELTDCNGADPSILAALECSIPLTTLRASPFDLTYGTLVQARVMAENANGWGSLSQVNLVGAAVETEPSQMGAPTMGSATTTTQLAIDFVALTAGSETGGSTIDSYHLQWDQGTGSWLDLFGEDGAYQLLTTYTVTSGVSGGSAYRFKVRAHNTHGWSEYSDEGLVYATSAPGQPGTVVTAQATGDIEIAWAAPANNYESIVAYRVVIEGSGGVFEEETTYCDGSLEAVIDALACLIPVSALTASPFSLSAGAVVVAKVQAQNGRGWGALSEANTAGGVIITVPHTMDAPARVDSTTTISQITVSWVAQGEPENGMSTVLSYNLEWDEGSSGTAWSEVVGESTDYTQTYFTVTTGVLAGESYQFRVRSRNGLGWGDASPSSTIKAATWPEKMDEVATSLDPATGGLLVSWTAPYDNAQTITAYKIEVQYGTDWSEETAGCDASDATIMSNMYCIIPLSALRATPFDLVYGDLLQARASAYNVYGWGETSDAAGAQTVRTEPLQMDPPQRGSDTTPSLLHVTWTPPSTDATRGGATITNYNVQWDAGTGGLDWYHLLGQSSDSLDETLEITTAVTGGAWYQVRVRAANVYGFGEYSTSLSIEAAQEPDQVTQSTLTSEVVGADVAFAWVGPGSNYDAITAYRVLIGQSDGTYSEESTYCPSNEASLASTLTCSVPLGILRAAPYSLAYGAQVLFTVEAYNGYGWSLVSQVNTAQVATIETEPEAPSPPVYEAFSSSLTTIALSWAGHGVGSDGTGGSAITSYHVQWKENSASLWSDLQGQDGALSTATSASASAGVTGGESYNFRVRASNTHGWGDYSSELTVLASGVPDQPSSPTTVLDSLEVVISWIAPGDNYGGITAYEISILDSTDTAITEATYCDGSVDPVFSELRCQVPMSYFVSSYGLQLGDIVAASVRAYGTNGWSAWATATAVGVTVQTVSAQMGDPSEGSLTSEYQIEVEWSALTTTAETGDSAILSYNLQWHAGAADTEGAVWESLAGDLSEYPGTSYIVTSGIVEGATYSFRLRAQNLWGWGDYSNTVELVASTNPDTVSTPSTSIDASTGGLVITWSAPVDHGSPITAYLIEVRDKYVTAWTEDSSCDGSSSSVVSALSCEIPMLTLTSSPYSYELEDLIVVRVSAYNEKGWGSSSTENTAGAEARAVPAQANAPTRASETAPTQIQVEWVALATTTETGGLAILSYQLEHDQASGEATGGSSWEDLIGYPSDSLLTTYTLSPTTGGEATQFRVRAKNALGWGLWSDVTTIAASAVPAQMQVVTTEIDALVDPLSVTISWSAPDDNSDSITSYQILILKADGIEYAEETDNCDGTDSTIVAANECLVLLTDLRTDFNLGYGDVVVARVRATNSLGDGSYSQPNTAGATIQTEPVVMGAPTETATSLSSISLAWVALTGDDIGGASIDSYQIDYGDGQSPSSWTAVQGADGDLSTLLSYSLGSLTAGNWYSFRVRAHNVHGWGDYSPTASFQAAQAPDQPSPAPTTALSDASVRIAWTAPSSNYKTISAYLIEILDSAGTNFYEEATECDGSTSEIVSALYCDVPVSVLRASPYNLDVQDLVVARVSAYNERGWGAASDANAAGALIETEPTQMASPVRGSNTGVDQLEITWSLLTSPEDGYSSVTTYALYWDAGTSGSTWTSLVGVSSDYLLSSYLVTEGVTVGESYQFKIQAENFWGWGSYSDVVTVVAATTPDQVSTPTTAIEAAEGAIVIAWSAPDERGNAITSYTVEIQDANGDWVAETSYCGGSTAVACTVPMSVAAASPYSLVQGELVAVRVSATNYYGTGTASAATTSGALVAVVPLTMSAPSRGTATSTSQVEIDWTLLTDPSNGGSEVTSYHLVWDAGTGTTTTTLVGLLTPYTLGSYIVTTGVTLGQSYKFKIRAENVYGWGSYSPEFSIAASEAPAQMQVATTSIVGTNARIAWQAPAENGESVTAYQVKVLQSDGVTYSEELAACDGSDSTIVSGLQCDIPLTTLRASPFNLVLSDLVRATVAAGNAQGFGIASQVNTDGGTIQTEPAQAEGLAFVAASSSTTQITISWTEPVFVAETGASPILEYYVDGAEDDPSPSWGRLGAVTAGTEEYTATGLTGGVTYLYRVQAVNLHGAGLASDTLSALAASEPDQPAAPTTTQVATGISVAWTEPTDNHLAVLEYEISVADSNGDLQVDTTLCDGSSATVISDKYCIIPIASLTGSPYSLTVDTLIEFAVRARNDRGWSPLSDRNTAGVLAQTVPTAMPIPFTEATQTGESQVYVEWSALTASTDTGGSAVTSYHLQTDSGSGDGTWSDVLGLSPASLATSIELTSAIVAGTTYIFRARASNIHGWGDWSPEVSIKAAQVPFQMASVSTAIESSAGSVTITWLAPADGSDTITAYLIEIKDTSGAWQAGSTYCDGTDSAVISALTCTVPMSTLRASPYSLAFDALVEVRASAQNSYGWGTASTTNAVGAEIRREPDQMAAPTAVGVAEAQIDLQWTALAAPEDGNSDVLAYTLYWDNGSGTTGIALLDALATSVSVPGLTGGVTYRFKVRARNVYGAGSFSPELAVLASDLPDKADIPAVTIGSSETAVTVTWVEPGDHAAAIDAYEILFLLSDGVTFSTETTYCDGSDSSIASALSCQVPMATVESVTGLAVDSLIRVKIRAQNANGWGDYSELNTAGATIETAPTQMATPAFVLASSSASAIALSWTAATGTAAGGSNLAITDYALEWDAGSGAWATHLITSSTTATSTGLTGGNTYAYRVAARNKYGSGPYSSEISVLAAEAPDTPATATTEDATIYVKVSWTAPSDNHATIDAYQILIVDSSGAFVEDTASCDGSSPTVVSALYCLIPMTSLWAAPFSLPQDTVVQAQVLAHNDRGWSSASTANTAGATVEVVPLQMDAVTRGSSTSDTAVQIDWTAVVAPESGGATVLGYALYTDDATGEATWTEVIGYTSVYSGTTFTQTAGVVAGSTYSFKVMAKNKWGWGEFSEPATILAATTPSTMGSATTTIASGTGGVTLSWDAPSSDGGIAITSYLIEVEGNDASWNTDSACDSADSTLVSNRECTIPMASLVASPHLLAFDTLVVVRITAINAQGSGPTGPANTAGANIRQAPAQMDPPTEGADTTDSQVVVEWSAVTDAGLPTGNSAITSYELLWDNGDSGLSTFFQLTLTSDLATSHTIVGVTEGASYRFIIRAVNVYGTGVDSTEATIRASDVPSRVDALTTARNLLTVEATWDEPSDNGAAVSAYQIEIWDPSTTAYVEDTSRCDGSDSTVITNRECTFVFTDLMSTFSYAVGELFVVRARAYNDDGWGELSSANTLGATIMTVPVAMGAPVEDAATSQAQIVLTWAELTSTVDIGGTAITSYEVYWDGGTAGASWAALRGYSSPDTSATFTTIAVVAGSPYQFQLRAENALGWGAYGPTTTVIPSSVPDEMATVTTSVYLQQYAKVEWVAPDDNGAAITAYRILIAQSDGTMNEESTYCPGSDATLMANAYCLVPFIALRASPYTLVQGDLVAVQVQAQNLKGWSTISVVNVDDGSNAVVETEPVAPAQPTRQATTDDFQVDVEWVALTSVADQGGPTQSITSYKVEWDDGTSGATWTPLVGKTPLSLATTFSATDASLSQVQANGVLAGQLYQVRVSAKNTLGWGPTSPVLSIYAAAVPEAPTAPGTAQEGTSMRISWAAPDNNGLTITSYHVLILESDGATWTESGECDGSDSTVVSNLYCDVATSTLRASGYALTLNDAVVAKVRAYNLIGWGDYSPQTSGFGAGTITTEPAAPPTPVSEGADTSDEQLHIEWAALTGDDAGQEDITSYTVMWDSGDGGSSWTLLTFQLAGSFTYTHTRSAGVTSGGSYQFKYRAGNQQGVGEYSDISTIIASTVPDTLGSATTLNSGSDVVVSWPATSSERGATVTAYRVKFLESDGVTYTESSACDGASATPKTNRECTVAMTVFTSSPYSLAIDAPIVAVVEALNAKGYSTPSAGDSTGAQAETEPTAGPTASRGGDTTTSSLEVTWTAVSTSPDNGGASVTEYLVYWDNGSGSSSASWSLAATTDASTTRAVSTTSISPGTTYQFAVKAKNVHGTGPLGPTLSVLAATVPDAPEGLTAGSVTSTSVTFTWSAPSDNGGSAVTDYSIDWDSGGSAFFSSLTTSTSGATTYTATGLSASTAYGFRVAASNAVGEGAPSGTFTISTSA